MMESLTALKPLETHDQAPELSHDDIKEHVDAKTQTAVADSKEQWYQETLHPHWRQSFRMDHVFVREKTDLQDLAIFENKVFGRVLALDGVAQTTQNDEFVYHEMMTHVPLLAHGNPETVLIIGGGDGGILREVARHNNVKNIVMVEIDPSVVELSKKHLPTLSSGAFDDPRLNLVIADAAEYVKKASGQFDVIICDSTDPFGPGAVLFSEEFYGNCKKVMREGGIFVNQNGVPFVQGSEIALTYSRRSPFFNDVGFYVAPVPTYIGGFMAFGWASDNPSYRSVSPEEISNRLRNVRGEMQYYTPDIHRATFALPAFIQKLIPTKA